MESQLRNMMMVFVVFAGLGITACNPVKFGNSDGQKPCNVSAPCLGPNGTYQVQQDLTFTSTNKVDILVVDDNSGSMTTEQANMGSPFNGFINNLNSSGLDWQIAVTSTDVCPVSGGLCQTPNNITGAAGRFIGPKTSSAQPSFGSYILNKYTSNVLNYFNSIVQRGDEVGSGDERGIYAANLAIDRRGTENAGFFRDNSNLAVIFLSDEDERSVGGLSPSDPGYVGLESYDQPQTLLNKISTTWNGSKSAIINSIVIKSGDSACLSQQASQGPYYTAHYGTVYEQASQLAQNQSVIGSICDNGSGGFASMLSGITGSIQNLPALKQMTLNYIPSATPVVSFNPPSNAVAWNWTPGTNIIYFSVRPASGTNVHVEYNYSASQQKSYSGMVTVNPKSLQIGFSQSQSSNGASDVRK